MEEEKKSKKGLIIALVIMIFLLLFFLVIIGAGIFYYISIEDKEETKELLSTEDEDDDDKKDENQKEEFVQADDMQTYRDDEAGFSLKYPENVVLYRDGYNTDENRIGITIKSEDIYNREGIKATQGYDTENLLKARESLEGGEFGEVAINWAVEESKKVRKINQETNARDYMVLARFEVCDVTFERSLLFFSDNDEFIEITLHAPIEEIIESMPEYFMVDKTSCADDKMWNNDKQGQFYLDLKNSKGSEIAQEWFDSFDEIVETIKIN